MKKILKGILITILIMSAVILFNTKEVNAGLQSNPNTNNAKKTDILMNWMKNIRAIETTGGAMGFNETIDSTTLKATSDSNGIDIHMMKTTEYGAIAILSASGYGNSSNDRALTTTTGNKTGVIINQSNWEWNAGGLEGYIFSGVSSKYYNTYTGSNTSARVGDALGSNSTSNPGCAGWHSADGSDWCGSRYGPYFGRGCGGIFSFVDPRANYGYYGRGVAVVGQGF